MVVSGLLTGSPESPTGRILDGMLQAQFPFVLSLELLAEYRAVLLREPIRKRHRLGVEQIEAVLTEIAANAMFREPANAPAAAPKTDPGDRHLVCLLAVHPTVSLVTGDRRLQLALQEFCAVHSPAEFVALKGL